MNDPEKTGRPFERLVAAVQRKLAPGARVESPFRLSGRSGSNVTLDAAVHAKVGSAELLVAIEAKDYRDKVGVEKVRAFAYLLQDIGANKGIIVAPFGFTRDALLTAESAGIDTCVLRPANDEDWNGYLRSFKLTVNMMADAYRDASIVLTDGRKIPVNEGGMALLADKNGTTVFFDRIIDYAISMKPDLQGANIIVTPTEPLWRHEGDSRAAVAELRCRRESVEGLTHAWLDNAPEDWIFVKHTPTGPVDEKAFFEFEEIELIAEEFDARWGQCDW
ncbi:restriction endonuclease [Sorangium sp. So ce260]|uniref:restriction endonuclease n=1 Tax=Sorangium sp. So ce260 TaxID=3133291 RepID=UPI003F5F6055